MISDTKKGARFLSMYLKEMFIRTLMASPEYMKVPLKYFPDDITDKYNLRDMVHNGYIYIKTKKRMYGLIHAAVLVYQKVSTLLKTGDYQPLIGSLGMWKHESRKTMFCLCVDDFGVKYYSK